MAICHIKNIAFVTDGDLYQVIGIASILHKMISVGFTNLSSSNVWIVSPFNSHNTIRAILCPFGNTSRMQLLEGKTRNDDRYYVQLGLAQVFELIEYDEPVLCLDYDHIVSDMSLFNSQLDDGQVFVSSEWSQQVPKGALVSESSIIDTNLPRNHYNVSILFGKAGTLRKIGREWKNAYESIRHLTSYRYRVELAFSLSAEQEKIKLTPCSSSLQANFAVPCSEYCLFHYGGEYSVSTRMKDFLHIEAERYSTDNNYQLRLDDINAMLYNIIKCSSVPIK